MPGLYSLILFIVSTQNLLPISSLRSSRSTLVRTACLICMILILFATFSASSQSTGSGLPVLTPQNLHDLVQIFPSIMNVAVPSPQHSPIFGQLPEVHIVCKLFSSTNFLSLAYFGPIGNLTLNQSGFFLCSIILLGKSTLNHSDFSFKTVSVSGISIV